MSDLINQWNEKEGSMPLRNPNFSFMKWSEANNTDLEQPIKRLLGFGKNFTHMLVLMA